MSHLSDEITAHEHLALAEKLKGVEARARKEAMRNRGRITGLQVEPTASVEDDAEDREPGRHQLDGLRL